MEYYNADGIFQKQGTVSDSTAETVTVASSVDEAEIDELRERLTVLEKSDATTSASMTAFMNKVYTKDEVDYRVGLVDVVFERDHPNRNVFSQSAINALFASTQSSLRSYLTQQLDTTLASYDARFERLTNDLNTSISNNNNYFEWYSPQVASDLNRTVYSVASLQNYTMKYGVYTPAYDPSPLNNVVYTSSYINSLITPELVKIGGLTLTESESTLRGISSIAGPLTIKGNLQIDGVITQLSDRAAKSDIKSLGLIDSVTKLWRLYPKVYSLADSVEYGLIADEVEDVVPVCVKTDAFKNKTAGASMCKTVNYVGLIPILINVCKFNMLVNILLFIWLIMAK